MNTYVHVFVEGVDVEGEGYYTGLKGCFSISIHLDHSLFQPSQKCLVSTNLRVLEPVNMRTPVHIKLDLRIPKDFDACWN